MARTLRDTLAAMNAPADDRRRGLVADAPGAGGPAVEAFLQPSQRLAVRKLNPEMKGVSVGKR
jgi:hypothetical protein